MIILFFLTIFHHIYKYYSLGKEYTFNQTLDHFSLSDHRTFKQRYFINFDYNRSETNFPIIVYIGGESTFSQTSVEGGSIIQVAKRTHALIAGLEHRFYGKSQPFDRISSEELRYLTVDQALEDLASFVSYLRNTYCPNNTCKVLVVGGSYSGALSSWFRLYYPHLADFSWSSSAPLNIKEKFPEYDASLANTLRSYNESCYSNTKLLLSSYHQIVASQNKQKISEFYNKYSISDEVDLYSSLSVIHDVISYAVQYNKGFHLISDYCIQQSGDEPNEKALRDLSANLLKSLDQTALYLDPFSYTSENPYDDTSSMRCWTWMTCNELGWFSTTAGFLSSFINRSYYDRLCAALFDNITVGNIESVSLRYGGTKPKSSYVVFTHGTSDPWSKVGVESIDSNISQYLFKIKDGSHCEDLKAESSDDSESLRYVRNQVVDILTDWINDQCTKKCSHGTCLHDRCLCDESWSGEFCEIRVVSSIRFWQVTTTAVVIPVVIMILIGGTAWWLFKRMHEEQLLLSLRY